MVRPAYEIDAVTICPEGYRPSASFAHGRKRRSGHRLGRRARRFIAGCIKHVRKSDGSSRRGFRPSDTPRRAVGERRRRGAARGARGAARGRRGAAGGARLHRQGARARGRRRRCSRSVTPGQMVVKIVHDALVEMLGGARRAASTSTTRQPPVPVLMVGLQGSGKTTTTAKLALRLKDRERQEGAAWPRSTCAGRRRRSSSPMLGIQAEVPTLPIVPGEPPLAIARRALQTARLRRLRRGDARHRRAPARSTRS